MTPRPTASKLDRITFKDWLLAAIGLAFTLAGLFIIRRDFNTGISTLVLFGLCFAHAVHRILRKRRAQKQLALTVSLAGGVPIRQSRGRMAILGGSLLAIGATQVAFDPQANGLILGIGWFLIAVGSTLMLGLAMGLLPIGYLQFDPAGITFAQRRGKAIVPWGAVTGLARGDMSNNPTVLIAVDADAIRVEPDGYRPALLNQLARTRGLVGADFMIMSGAYGIDAPVLLAALQRYVTEPASRHELRSLSRISG
jgi:hypothetical protein